MAVEEPSQTAENARRSRQVRARARPRDMTEQLNVFAKAAALGVLIALVGVGAFGRFYSARFSGLISTAAMEAADVAEQLRQGRGLSTKVVQPLGLAYAKPNADGVVPVMRHAPLYPYLLSWLFRARGSGDGSVAMFNGIVFLLTAWMVYVITRKLWDKVTAIVVVLLYLVSIEAIGQALTGTGTALAALLLATAVWGALRSRAAIESSSPNLPADREGRSAWLWLGIMGASFGLTYLVGLTSFLLIIPLVVIGTASGPRRRQHIAFAIAVATVVVTPWVVHNLRVTGTVLPPLAKYALLTGTASYPGQSVYQQMPGEVPHPITFAVQHPGEILGKVARGLTGLYRGGPNTINVYLFPFFILGAFVFARLSSERLLWRTVVAMAVLQGLSICLFSMNVEGMSVVLPLAVALAGGCLVAMLRRSDASRLVQIAVAIVLLGLVLFPTVSSAVIGKKTPPNKSLASIGVFPAFLKLPGDAVIATAEPALVARYAGRTAVLVPEEPAEIATLWDQGLNIQCVYLTGNTVHEVPEPGMLKWAQAARSPEFPEGLAKRYRIPPHGEVLFERTESPRESDAE